MNIYVTDKTIVQWVNTSHVKHAIDEISDDLFGFDTNIKSIYVVFVDVIPVTIVAHKTNYRTVGACARHKSQHTYIIHIVDGNEWRFTLAHELYHAFQREHGMPLTEPDANEFAQFYE